MLWLRKGLCLNVLQAFKVEITHTFIRGQQAKQDVE